VKVVTITIIKFYNISKESDVAKYHLPCAYIQCCNLSQRI